MLETATFPTTLREISNVQFIKVCVEYNGKRYLIGQTTNYESAEAVAEPYINIKGAYVYATDKSDSTHISGGCSECEIAISNHTSGKTRPMLRFSPY